MTTEVLAQALVANQQATFGQGRIWYIKSAAAALTIICEKNGSGAAVRKFVNVGAGFKFTADPGDGWSYLRVTSAVNQNIEIIIGDDDVEVANAVSVSGSVSVQDAPSTAITVSAADTAVANTSAASIAANLARRRITIGALAANTGNLRVQSTGAGANKGLELQPGIYVELRTTAAIDVRNDSGASQSFWVFEET